MFSHPKLEPLQRGVVLVLVLLLVGAFPYFGRLMNANERPRLLQGMAWIDEGTSAIDGPAARGIAPGIDVSVAPSARGGRLYPNKPPGATVPAALSYAALRAAESAGGPAPTLRAYTQLARVFGGLLPTLVIVFVAFRRIQGENSALCFAVVAYALGTPALSYARVLFGHQLAAACLFVGVSLIDRGMRPPITQSQEVLAQTPASRRRVIVRCALGGMLAGSAVAVEYLAAFAGIPIAVWLLVRVRREGLTWPVAAAVAGAVVPVALLAAYHHQVFGSPWATPYHFVAKEGFAAVHAQGLLGLSWPSANSLFEHLVSPWGGLLYWAPLAVLAFMASAKALWRRTCGDFEAVALGIFALLTVLNLCLVQTGGWRVGPRYLVVALPFVLPGLVRVFSWSQRRPTLWAMTVALLGWSMFINFFAAAFFPHLIPTGNPLSEFLLPLWVEGLRPYTIWQAIGLGPVALEGLALFTLALFVFVTQPKGGRRALATWSTGVLGAVVLLASAAKLPGSVSGADGFFAVQEIWEPGGARAAPQRVLRAIPERDP